MHCEKLAFLFIIFLMDVLNWEVRGLKCFKISNLIDKFRKKKIKNIYSPLLYQGQAVGVLQDFSGTDEMAQKVHIHRGSIPGILWKNQERSCYCTSFSSLSDCRPIWAQFERWA